MLDQNDIDEILESRSATHLMPNGQRLTNPEIMQQAIDNGYKGEKDCKNRISFPFKAAKKFLMSLMK